MIHLPTTHMLFTVIPYSSRLGWIEITGLPSTTRFGYLFTKSLPRFGQGMQCIWEDWDNLGEYKTRERGAAAISLSHRGLLETRKGHEKLNSCSARHFVEKLSALCLCGVCGVQGDKIQGYL